MNLTTEDLVFSGAVLATAVREVLESFSFSCVFDEGFVLREVSATSRAGVVFSFLPEDLELEAVSFTGAFFAGADGLVVLVFAISFAGFLAAGFTALATIFDFSAAGLAATVFVPGFAEVFDADAGFFTVLPAVEDDPPALVVPL